MSEFPDVESAITACISQVMKTYSAARFKGYAGQTVDAGPTASKVTTVDPLAIRNVFAEFEVGDPTLKTLDALAVSSLDLGPWKEQEYTRGDDGTKEFPWPVKLSLVDAWARKNDSGYTDPVEKLRLEWNTTDSTLEEPAYRFRGDVHLVFVGAMTGKVVLNESLL